MPTEKQFNALVKLVQALDMKLQDQQKQLTSLRLDLKSAGILHDEEYVPPPVDELAARPSAPIIKKKSKVEELAEKQNLFS